MKKTMMVGALWGVLGLFFAGCSEGSGGGASNLVITFVSSTLSGAVLNAKQGQVAMAPTSGTNCSVSVDGSPVTGKCYTPVRVAGFFSSASLGSTFGGAGVRILGGGDTLSGFADIFRHEAFDLKDQIAMNGDDNIQDGSGGPYNILSLNAQVIEYSFEANVGSNKVYTVRLFFADSVPSGSTTLTSCGLSDGELGEADTYGALYSTIAARRGDIMVCIKSATTDVCADSDFLWVDSSGATHATRPGSPLQLTGTYLTGTPSCTMNGDRPDITWSNTDFIASLGSSGVSVSAELSGDSKTYTVGSESGSKLDINVDIAATEALFIPSSASAVTNLASVADEATLLQNLDDILLKPIYANNAKSSAASSGDATLNATVALTVSE